MNRFVLSILLLFFLGTSMASDRYLKIVSPDGRTVLDPDSTVTVSGTGKGLFEGNVVIRFEDIDGKLLVQKPTIMHRQDIAAAGQWQASISLPAPVPETVRLIAFSPSPKDGEAAITSAPVTLVIRRGDDPALEGGRWRLNRYLDETGNLQPVIPGTVIDARFADGKIAGIAGCNRYFGGYMSGEKNQLVFDDRIGSTRMACEQPVASQEYRYLALLAGVAFRELGNGQLSLFDKEGQLVLKYSAELPLTLENTRWQASGINNGRGGVVSSETTRRVTAVFAEGRVSGSAGCNNFSASYEAGNSKITIGPAMTTRKQCTEPEGILEQEQEFLQALAAVTQYGLAAERLELRDGSGSLQVVFTGKAALQ